MEFKIVKFFNHLGSGTFNNATDFVSRIKYLIIFWSTVALAFLLLNKDHGRQIFFGIIIASVLHFSITEGIFKHLLTKIFGKRARPYIKHVGIKPIGRKFTDSSFPSSHMAIIVAISSVIVYFENFWFVPAMVLILFMAYARMHQGMHYLSDIIFGSLLGFLYGLGGIYLTYNFLK